MTTEGETPVLRRLALALAEHATEGRTAWQALEAQGALFGTTAALFLLDNQPDDGAEGFAVYTLGRLVETLSRRREPLQVEHEGRVRGRIVWPATYKARYDQDYNPARFVCREVQREYDTPENQLVRYVIERIAECVKGVPAPLRAGFYYLEPVLESEPHPVADHLENIAAALARVQRNTYLRQVTLPPRLTEVHLLRAEIAELDEYRTVLRFYEQYRQLTVPPTWARAAAAGKRVLPLPRSTGGENEIWIRLGAEILRA
jgi:hypothetical protein